MLFRFTRRPMPLLSQLSFIVKGALLLLCIDVANEYSGRALNQFGIIPRDPEHWYGILAAPLLHANFLHFSSNIIPLAIFTLLVFQHGRLRFWLTTLGIVILGGGAVWLYGRPAVHLGASGLIFGYFGFLVMAGVISKELKLLGIAILVVFFYGGLILGILPQEGYVSYESHLFGFIAGIAMALLIGRANQRVKRSGR